MAENTCNWGYGAPINGLIQWVAGVIIPISGIVTLLDPSCVRISAIESRIQICIPEFMITPPKTAPWNLKKAPWKRLNIYKPPIFGFPVSIT